MGIEQDEAFFELYSHERECTLYETRFTYFSQHVLIEGPITEPYWTYPCMTDHFGLFVLYPDSRAKPNSGAQPSCAS